MTKKLMIARPSGWQSEKPEVGTYIAKLMGTIFTKLSKTEDIEIDVFTNSNARILMMRNQIANAAVSSGCTHLLMIDPDMDPDRYVDSGASPFFDTAWPFILKHPCSVVGSPYVGRPPHKPVHVFGKNAKGEVVRISREQAAAMKGITAVEAIGSGLLLIDCEVFKRLPVSWDEGAWFDDVYKTPYKTDLLYSQDVFFCRKCRKHGIPLYCNWDAPSGHYQDCCCDWPTYDLTPEQANEKAERERNAPPPIPELCVQGKGDVSWR